MDRSRVIKEEIEKRYKSVRQFAKIAGISYTTLLSALGKEDGFGSMSIENALKVCHALGIDINSMGKTNSDFSVNQKEQELIENYRKLSGYNQETLRIIAKRMVEGCKVLIKTVDRPVFELRVSAGTGLFLDSDDYEIWSFPENEVPPDSTFGIYVSGDSMEPEFKDGSIVFVKKTKNLNIGEIGIFVLNGEGYLKKLGSGKLISLNPNYEDIPIGKYDDCRIIGKVVGKYNDE